MAIIYVSADEMILLVSMSLNACCMAFNIIFS